MWHTPFQYSTDSSVLFRVSHKKNFCGHRFSLTHLAWWRVSHPTIICCVALRFHSIHSFTVLILWKCSCDVDVLFLYVCDMFLKYCTEPNESLLAINLIVSLTFICCSIWRAIDRLASCSSYLPMTMSTSWDIVKAQHPENTTASTTAHWHDRNLSSKQPASV